MYWNIYFKPTRLMAGRNSSSSAKTACSAPWRRTPMTSSSFSSLLDHLRQTAVFVDQEPDPALPFVADRQAEDAFDVVGAA
jgi:hypothetical protein